MENVALFRYLVLEAFRCVDIIQRYVRSSIKEFPNYFSNWTFPNENDKASTLNIEGKMLSTCLLFVTKVFQGSYVGAEKLENNHVEDADISEVIETMRQSIETKAKNHKISTEEIKSAQAILGGSTFEEYTENWDTRFLSFERRKTQHVIGDIAEEYNWEKSFAERIMRTAQNELRDTRTNFKFHIRREINVLYVFFSYTSKRLVVCIVKKVSSVYCLNSVWT